VATKLLSDAFEQASQLPEADQDALGEWLLQELKCERRWDQLFDSSSETLGFLADQALAEHRAGKTLPLRESDF
jgi:hypothetical protein